MKNEIEFELCGDYALFTDPVTKIGGEKFSYSIPTYEALKGIASSIYWKPTLIFVIDEMRVINPIQMESKGIRPIEYNGGNTLANYTYLRDVRYQVRAHFEFNMNRSDMAFDRNEGKHFSILQRSLKVGGCRDIFLGARECQGYVEPCVFGSGKGFYDNEIHDYHMGTMVHGFDYPDETGRDELEVRLWHPIMRQGIIAFSRPEDCTIVRSIREMTAKTFTKNTVKSVDQLSIELGGE